MGQIGIFGYWMNSYWGGAVAGAGGCLVLGALARLERRVNLSATLAACLGVALLAFSRPLEGSIVVIGACVMVLIQRRRRLRKLSQFFVPAVVIPALLIGSCVTAATVYYNYRVTGHPLLLPYVLYERTYARAPFLLFMPIRDLTYRHDVMRKYYSEQTLQLFRTKRTHPWINVLMLQSLLSFYTSALVLFAALAGAFFVRNFRVRMALVVLAALCLILVLEKSPHSHYIAAGCGLFFALAMYGIRFLGLKAGRYGPALLFLFVLISFCQGLAEFLTVSHSPNPRTILANQLMKTGGQHLVIVHYDTTQPFRFEYVYNRADIDSSPIVWARDMGAAKNRELIDYYRSRKVWLLQADHTATALTPYPEDKREGGGAGRGQW
jgi:hypothetical protein